MIELLCDYDGAVPRDWAKRLALVTRAHRVRPVLVLMERSGSGRGWHVRVVLVGRVAFWRVVLMQALLGSDWKREMFNSRRAMAWRNVPAFWRSRANVLYSRHHHGVNL